MRVFLLKISKVILFLGITYIILFSVSILRYKISDYYFSKLVIANKNNNFTENEVKKVLFLFSADRIQPSESLFIFMVDNKKDKYFVQYSLICLPSIEIVYDNKQHIVQLLPIYM